MPVPDSCAGCVLDSKATNPRWEAGMLSCPVSSSSMGSALIAPALTLVLDAALIALRPPSSSVLLNLTCIGEDARIRASMTQVHR